MRQEISALMDGELFDDEAEALFDGVRRDQDAHQDWAIYHLIGDALRQPEHIHCDLSARVSERMQDEPVVMAPRARASTQRLRNIALSAAASLVAVAVVSWMSLQISPEVAPQLAMKQPALSPASARIQPKSNDYLMAHHEFSPSSEMNGGASYIRTVSYYPEEK
ncbi:MAG: sigma-E factor negative regulatory protein [Gallionella sp.]|nr:sigma-E factor negative regulatory protein [Gallionella sp.]